MNTKLILLPFHLASQTAFLQQFPGSQTLLPLLLSVSKEQLHLQLEQLSPLHQWAVRMGPHTTQGHQLIWVQHKDVGVLESFSKQFSSSCIHKSYVQIQDSLFEHYTIDPSLCSLLFLNPFNRTSAPKFVYRLHTHFLFSSFKSSYFNEWYEDHQTLFEQLGFQFTFTTEEDPSCTIDGQGYCTKEQIEQLINALKDLAKHYKGRLWCTQTIDELQSIEDLCEHA